MGRRLSFKDVAMQMIGPLFDSALEAAAINSSQLCVRHRATLAELPLRL